MTQQFISATPSETYAPPRAPGNGCVSLFMLMVFSIVGIITSMGLSDSYGRNVGLAAWVIFGLLWITWLVLLLKRRRLRVSERLGVDVLRSILDFHLPAEYYDVGVTAFCRPDSICAGEATTLLIFAQNYSNRDRRLTLKLPKTAVLGSLTKQTLRWTLCPGQCVVYRACFEVPVDLPPGTCDMAIKIQVKLPNGQGSRLIPKVNKGSGLSVTRIRTASFGLDIEGHRAGEVNIPSGDCPPPQFISLYTPALAEPRFEVLQQVSTSGTRDVIEL